MKISVIILENNYSIMKENYNLVSTIHLDNIENIKMLHNIQNFQNYEKCAVIVNDPRFIFKKHYIYPRLYGGDGLKNIFYHCCKHGYINEMKILITHEDGGKHISEIQDKLNHPEKYGYDNYDIDDKNKFIKEMSKILTQELDTDDIKYTLSLNTIRFALMEYGFKQKKVVKLLLSMGISEGPSTPSTRFARFGHFGRKALYTDTEIQMIYQMYKILPTISKNGGSHAITMDVLCKL